MGKRKRIKEAVGTIVRPVNFLIEKFNSFMKKMEKSLKKEKVSEIDGFVDELVEEVGDAEKGLFSFFGELLFIHNLTPKIPTEGLTFCISFPACFSQR